MKKVTSTTTWSDSAGQRLSVTYIEIDDTTHEIINDNARKDYILSDEDTPAATALTALAQSYLEAENNA